MNITHTWSINSLSILNNGYKTVSEVGYTVSSIENSTGTTVSIQDSIKLEVDNIENFVPYDSLTESVVIGWVQSKLGFNKESIEQTNSTRISFINNPPTSPVASSSLPWAGI